MPSRDGGIRLRGSRNAGQCFSKRRWPNRIAARIDGRDEPQQACGASHFATLDGLTLIEPPSMDQEMEDIESRGTWLASPQ